MRGRCILDIKHSGEVKSRMVKQGWPGSEPPSPGRESYTNLTTAGDVRMILAQPDERYNNRTTVVIDFSNAYGQGDAWREDEIKRFLKIINPVTKQVEYWRECKPIYGGQYAGNNWEETIYKYLKEKIGMTQGDNSRATFHIRTPPSNPGNNSQCPDLDEADNNRVIT